MKKFVTTVYFFAVITSLQAMPSFTVDYAVFRAADFALLQVYTMIQRGSLEHAPTDSTFNADYSIMVEILRDDSVLTSVTNDRTDRSGSIEEIGGNQKIPDESSFHIKPGTYILAVEVIDLNNNDNRRREIEITVEEFPAGKIALSDVELGTRIEKVQESGKFVKNRLLVIPNADGMYGGDLMTGYYYMEIYNLCLDETGKDYTVKRSILDENKEPVKDLPQKVKPQSAGSVVEADLFSCATLGTGSYYLRLEVIDGCNGKRAIREKRFWVYRPGDEVTPQSAVAYGRIEEKIGKLSIDDAKDEIEQLRYLTNRSENKVINNLQPEGYKQFLINFWRNKDSSGELRYRYMTRVEVANEKYTSPFKEGWKTDRGRTLIVYGNPDYLERRNFDLGGPDLEVWNYDRIEGGVLFVFSDLKGTGDFQQVYSTKRGEFNDAGWIRSMEERDPGALQDLGGH